MRNTKKWESIYTKILDKLIKFNSKAAKDAEEKKLRHLKRLESKTLKDAQSNQPVLRKDLDVLIAKFKKNFITSKKVQASGKNQKSKAPEAEKTIPKTPPKRPQNQPSANQKRKPKQKEKERRKSLKRNQSG